LERIALLATAPDGGFPTDPVAGLELRAAGGGLLLQARTAGDVLLGSWLQGGDGAAAAGHSADAPGDALGLDALRVTLDGVRHTITDDQLARLMQTGAAVLPLDGGTGQGLRVQAVWIASKNLLFLETPSGGLARFGLSDAQLAGTGTLSLTPDASLDTGPLDDLLYARSGGRDWLIGASAAADDVLVWRIGGDGTLTEAGRLPPGIGVGDPSALQLVRADGRDFLVVAGAGSGSLSVLELGGDGSLTLTDHVLDDRVQTRFAGARLLDADTLDDRPYLLAGGGDDGVSLLTVIPGGRLVHLGSVADSTDTTLGGLSALALAAAGGTLQLFAASEREPGVTQLAFDPGPAGGVQGGSPGADVLAGGARNDILSGGAGNDTLNGAGGDDILLDGPGADRLRGGPGADLFVLTPDGARDTIVDFDPAADRLDLSDFPMLRSIDQLDIAVTDTGAVLTWRDEEVVLYRAGGGSLSRAQLAAAGILDLDRPARGIITDEPPPLMGGTGPDRLLATSAGQALYGEAGDDILSSVGTTVLDGGAGRDRADYSHVSVPVYGDLALLAVTVGADWHDTLSSIEDLWGGAGADTLLGDSAANRLSGGDGHDLLDGRDGDDTLWGGRDDDTLRGDRGDDTLWGDRHHDLLEGGRHHDVLDGGKGDDTLEGGKGDDTLEGRSGKDRLMGRSGVDSLDGGKHDDFVDGGKGDDTVLGGKGDDTLDGGSGRDLMDGGSGRDTLIGGKHDDILIGDKHDDVLDGGKNHDLLDGGRHHDALAGGKGDDTLLGGKGDDTLDGGKGADTLDGGRGRDTLTGGKHADTFVYREDGSADRITDFRPGDDRLLLDPGLWKGTLSPREVVDRHATTGGGGITLDFGDGDSLWLDGVTSFGALAGSIEFL